MKDQLHFTIKEDKIFLVKDMPFDYSGTCSHCAHNPKFIPEECDCLNNYNQVLQKAKDNAVEVDNQELVKNALLKKLNWGSGEYRFEKGTIYTLTGYKVEKYNWINPCIPNDKCAIADADGQNNCDQINERRCKNLYVVAVISPIEPEEESTINYRVIDYRVINNQIPLHECWGLKPEETKSDKPLLVKWTKIDAENYKYMNEVVKQNNDLQKELAELKEENEDLNQAIEDNHQTKERQLLKLRSENAELKKELDRAKQIISGKTFHDGLSQFKRNLKEKLLNEVCGTVDSYAYDKIITFIDTL